MTALNTQRRANAIRSEATPVRVLSRSITLAGIVATSAFVAHVALSWFLAPLAHYDARSVGQYEFFARIGDAIPWMRGRSAADLSPLQLALQQSLHARGVFESRRLRPLLEIVHHDAFRRAAAVLSGYDVAHMSEIVADLN